MVYVILPAFNEENSIERLITSFYENVVLESNINLKLIAVNDGSTDRTEKIITKIQKRFLDKFEIILLNHSGNKGLAVALNTGFAYSISCPEKRPSKDVIVTMDADNTHPPAIVLRMVSLIREGADVVIGSRYRSGSRVIGLSPFRRFMSGCANWFFRILFTTKGIKDFTCGYRAYGMDVIQKAIKRYEEEFISEQGFACTVDILLKLRAMDFVFVETPLILRYDRKEDASKMKVGQTIFDTLNLAFRRKLGIL